MSSIAQLLEAFDDADQSVTEHPEFTRGFAAGLAHAAEREASQAAQAAETLARLIEDATFGYTEARQAVLKDLNALVSALLDTLVPTVVDRTLLTYVANAVSQYAEATVETAPEFQMHPNTRARIESEVHQVIGTQVNLRCDDRLAKDSIHISTNDGSNIIDLSDAIDAVHAAFSMVMTSPDTPKTKER